MSNHSINVYLLKLSIFIRINEDSKTSSFLDPHLGPHLRTAKSESMGAGPGIAFYGYHTCPLPPLFSCSIKFEGY